MVVTTTVEGVSRPVLLRHGAISLAIVDCLEPGGLGQANQGPSRRGRRIVERFFLFVSSWCMTAARCVKHACMRRGDSTTSSRLANYNCHGHVFLKDWAC